MLQGIKNTVKSSMIYGLGNISTKLVGIILLPLFTNTSLISIEEFGVLGVVDVSIQILIAVFGLSLYQAFFRWYWDKKYIDVRNSIFFTLLITLMFLVAAVIVVGYFTSAGLSSILFNKEIYARVLFYMLVSSSLQVLSQLPLSYMRLEEKPLYYTISNVSRLLVILLFTILFITRMGRGLEGIYEAQILGNLFFMLITSRYIFNRIIFKFNGSVLKEMLEYSIPLTVASVLGIVLASLDRYVLNYKATLLDVGIYTLAFRIANTIRVFIVHSIQLAVAPNIFKLMNHPNNKAIYARIMTYFTLLVIYASLGLSIFGYEILTIFSSDNIYVSAYKLIPIIALGIIFGTAKDVAINGLNIVKKTKIVSYIVLPIAVFHLGLNFAIIPILGVYGAAIASAISQGIFLLVVLYFAQKYYPIPFEYKRILLSLLLAVLIFIASNQLSPLEMWPKFVVKMLLVISFPFFLWIFSFLKDDEKQWVNGGIKKIKELLGF
jgi:O-antigen/teichoic acid export membrane protein